MDADLRAALGLAVKVERLRVGLSQEELADRAGVERAYIGRLERGKSNPTITTLARIGGALGVPAWRLLRSAGEGT